MSEISEICENLKERRDLEPYLGGAAIHGGKMGNNGVICRKQTIIQRGSGPDDGRDAVVTVDSTRDRLGGQELRSGIDIVHESGSGVGDVGEVDDGGGGTASMTALAHDGAPRLQRKLSRAKKHRYSEWLGRRGDEAKEVGAAQKVGWRRRQEKPVTKEAGEYGGGKRNAGTPHAIKPAKAGSRNFLPSPEEYTSIMAIQNGKIWILYVLEATILGFPVIYEFTERRRGRAEGI
ncbi:hypothetical protein B0H19DRAFT_1079651 [Mycena capillaripes]|nr:hypothetical protein B0H19DRAFT_1079651 [Mycena capillaripes]